MSVKSLNLTAKTLGNTPLELQTDGDVQRRDLSHLDGRELQVCLFLCLFVLYDRKYLSVNDLMWEYLGLIGMLIAELYIQVPCVFECVCVCICAY